VCRTFIVFMSFSISELHEIISVVSDVVFMGDSGSQISILTGVEFVESTDCDEQYFEITCSLKHGMMAVKVWDSTGIISYTLPIAAKPIQSVEFDDVDVNDRSGSFHVALKTILKADRSNLKNLVSGLV
jgi:hypothetical protein